VQGDPAANVPLGQPRTNSAVTVSNGLFTTVVDCGSIWDGTPMWLEIGVKPAGSANFTNISPRQLVTPPPKATYANRAGSYAGPIDVTQLPVGVVRGYADQTLTGAFTFDPTSGKPPFSVKNSVLVTNLNADKLDGFDAGDFWQVGGNANPANPVIGTGGTQPLQFIVGNQRALQLEFTSVSVARNTTLQSVNVVGGARGNVVLSGVAGGTIGGGGNVTAGLLGSSSVPNVVSDDYGTVGGGLNNLAGSDNGIFNDASGATVGGGGDNRAEGAFATVSGGQGNYAESTNATVSGGSGNFAGDPNSVIAGGTYNSIQSFYGLDSGSCIGGGENNGIGGAFNLFSPPYFYGSSNSVIGGGVRNGISAADYAVIPGGSDNYVGGSYGFAAGRRAQALHTGSFVWADSTDEDFASGGADQFLVRASGGVQFKGNSHWDVTHTEGDFRVGTDNYRLKIGVALDGGGAGDVWIRAHGGTSRMFIKAPGGITMLSDEAETHGVSLAAGGGAWTTVSDRNAKENFAAVNTREVLEKVAALPVQTWNYKSQPASIRHIGPMAQDFSAAFHCGETNTGITTVDADGVALAAIQGLNQKLEEKELRVKALEEKVAELQKVLEALIGQKQ